MEMSQSVLIVGTHAQKLYSPLWKYVTSVRGGVTSTPPKRMFSQAYRRFAGPHGNEGDYDGYT
jgi:hypothetical protein